MTKAIRCAAGFGPIFFALAFAASAQEADQMPLTDDTSVGTGGARAYDDGLENVPNDMAMEPTGNADVDFVLGMIPHHQNAIDMAEAALELGRGPEIKALAQEIIAAHEAELRWMQDWLIQNGYNPATGGPFVAIEQGKAPD